MALGKLVNLCSVQLHFGKTLAAVPSGKVVGINFATPFIGYLALWPAHSKYSSFVICYVAKGEQCQTYSLS